MDMSNYYTGTLTHTYTDPDLILTATLTDGTKVHVLRDSDPTSPSDWDEPATLVLTRNCERFTLGEPESDVHDALIRAVDYFDGVRLKYNQDGTFADYWGRDGCIDRAQINDPEVMVARYMRLMHGVEVMPVSLSGSSQSDWAEGWLILDNLDTTHGAGYELKPGEGQEILKGCAQSWRTYWAGDVYGYIHTDADGEEIDSCWGFYLNPDETVDSWVMGGCDGHTPDGVESIDYAY